VLRGLPLVVPRFVGSALNRGRDSRHSVATRNNLPKFGIPTFILSGVMWTIETCLALSVYTWVGFTMLTKTKLSGFRLRVH
jgi:hypothetical protein